MALEFALVGPIFALCLMFIIEVAYDLYAQEMLDFGMQSAARQIQIGAAQGVAPQNGSYSEGFKQTYLCPQIAGLLNCAAISINVTPVSDFYSAGAAALPKGWDGKTTTTGFTYCPGQPNQLILVTAVLTSPSIVAGFVPSLAIATGNTFVRATLSTVAFINEDFPTPAVSPCAA